MYPATGFTKAQVIDYYRQVAPALLAYLSDRPITLKRFPDGVNGSAFYEKNCPHHHPEWLRTFGRRFTEDRPDFCLIDNLPGLLWLANLASLEIHAYRFLASAPNTATDVILDLDPGHPATILDCARLALTIRDLLDTLNLVCIPHTSGGKGLHVYIPLNSDVNYTAAKSFARAVARTLEKHYPDIVVSRMSKSLREGKILVDWSQNDIHKSTVSPFSLRAHSEPTVSTPLTFDELEHAIEADDPEALTFHPSEIVDQLDQRQALLFRLLSISQSLPNAPLPME